MSSATQQSKHQVKWAYNDKTTRKIDKE